MTKTNISWSDEVWNPVTGCSHVSAGCLNCYAETLSRRRGWTEKPWTARNAAENIKLHPDRLDAPLHWRRPRMVFVNSMSDLFHEQVPFEFVDHVFCVMASAPQHTFQVLTKRPERMLEYFRRVHSWPLHGSLNHYFSLAQKLQEAGMERQLTSREAIAAWRWPLLNVWLGVSCEDQKNADERIPLLLQTPAAVRFISAEPLLGPINLSRLFVEKCQQGCGEDVTINAFCASETCGCCAEGPEPLSMARLDWVIVGGESGTGHRTMDLEWFRSLHSQCFAFGVPFFAKQDSGFRPDQQGRIPDALWLREFPRGREAVSA